MISQSKQFRIGFIALVIVAIHIFLSVIVFFAPEQILPHNRVVNLYRQLVLLGPFFTESRIKYSHRLAIQYKHDNVWSQPREFGKERFAAYIDQPWKVQHLAYIGYEKMLAAEIAQVTEKHTMELVLKSSSFREMNSFLTNELIKFPVDSIRILYGLDHYHLQQKSFSVDTLFMFTYNPNTVGKIKE
jgi:hypothetical protein